MKSPEELANADIGLARARALLAEGKRELAFAAYLELLKQDPDHHAALHELGAVAHADGFRSAARTIFSKIVELWPDDLTGRINLATILQEDGELASAREHFEAALSLDSSSAAANRGLGQIFYKQGDHKAADRHWLRSFPEQAVAQQHYQGKNPGIPLLLLVSAKGGNIPTRHFIDDRVFEVAALYAEYYKPALPLPPHAIVFNAIGDVDLCEEALANATLISGKTKAPIVNQPDKVIRTGRASNADRLAGLPGLRVPRILSCAREKLSDAEKLGFPLLLRAKGYHTGQFFEFVEDREALITAAASMPGDELLAIEYLDARGPDGMARKYRIMHIDGALYPIHLAISAGWKVHYFTADMSVSGALRSEEQRFLEDMPATLGPRAMMALQRIFQVQGLDYAGIDFAIAENGDVQLFEVNATMLIHSPSLDPIWDYRRKPIAQALDAAKSMLMKHSAAYENEALGPHFSTKNNRPPR